MRVVVFSVCALGVECGVVLFRLRYCMHGLALMYVVWFFCPCASCSPVFCVEHLASVWNGNAHCSVDLCVFGRY